MSKCLYKKVDKTIVTNMAIRFVKSYPCCICGLEKTTMCNYKKQGACPIFKSLKQALKDVKEVQENE
jgi:hypothetical protein